jgi:ABC-type glutathione transport system ATPase component
VSGELLLDMRDLAIDAERGPLVRGVSLQVHAGRVVALVGESGSGKTVSARAAMGVIDIVPGLTAGSLRYPAISQQDLFAGVAGRGRDAHRRLERETAQFRGGYLAYSPQSASSALNPSRTIGRQLAIAIARRNDAPASLSVALREVLAEVGLPERAAAALPGELSGGMAQRAALAIAIAPLPRILIADEPETGLDPVLRRVVTELMLDVARRHRVALLLISHTADTVRRIADDVVRIGKGGARV